MYKQPPPCGRIPYSPSGEAVWNYLEGNDGFGPVVQQTVKRGLYVLPFFLVLGFGWKKSLLTAAISTTVDTLLVTGYLQKNRRRCGRKSL